VASRLDRARQAPNASVIDGTTKGTLTQHAIEMVCEEPEADTECRHPTSQRSGRLGWIRARS
jgi:hypothetical protein